MIPEITARCAEPEALQSMRESPFNFDTTLWAAYENQALDHSELGRVKFLAVGPQNTFKEAPARLPDTHKDIHWMYCFIGYVNLETGVVETT